MEEAHLKKATPENHDNIEILQPINEKEIDVLYFEKAYYLQPDKYVAKAYCLLRDVLKKDGKVVLGPMVYHKREWICCIKPLDNLLVLHKIRFAEEIRNKDEINIPKEQVKPDELKFASMLIGQLTKPFKPEEFKDEYTDKLLKVIEAKAKGKGSKVKPLKVVHSATTEDLMQKLKASLTTTTKKAS